MHLLVFSVVALFAVPCTGDEPGENREKLEEKRFEMDVGSNEKFDCSLKNETVVKWYLDGTVVSKENVKVSGLTFSITNIQPSDGGTYECRGQKYTRFYTISVNDNFDNTPLNQTLINGTSDNLTCGAVKTEIEWKKEGNKTLDKGRFTRMPNGNLRVYPVRPEDKGNYICTIKQNKGEGRITSKPRVVHVSVVVPPVIQVSGPNHAVREGVNVSLRCIINEGSKPTIRWSKDGSPLHVDGKTVLNLTKVTADDEGWYTCKAKNDGGSSNGSIFITVDIPPKANPEFKSQSVQLNSTLTMKCIVGGDPAPNVTWTKNGTHLANTNNTLIINRVTFSDAGQYGCSAENRAGKINTTIWIDVTVAPQVVVSSTNQTVAEGNATTISCKVTAGVPMPTLFWSFNNERLSPPLVTETEDESVIKVQNATKDMEGTYMCTARNKASEATATSTLHVLEKPTAKLVQKSLPTIAAGDDLQLSCKVSDTTEEVKWKKNGSPVIPRARISWNNDTSRLVIENVRSDDSGVYSCEAHNQAGFMSSTMEIKIRAALSGGETLKLEYIISPIAAVIVLAFFTWCICKRRMKGRKVKTFVRSKLADEEQGFELEETNHEVDHWEIPRDRIVLREVIGTGAFGAVWKATLSEPDGGRGKQIVAAKCFIPTAGADGRKALMREIELGKLLNEKSKPNIVKFLGCVTTQMYPIMIMEYLAYGDLLGYLRKSRGIQDKYHLGEGEVFELKPYDLVLFAKQIAAGMVYLGSRGVIHRDLAARNVLLDRNFICKVTDFGLAYQNFKYGHGNAKKGCIPIKWTAPEILSGNAAALSTKSDVWSYGVVLYEIFTIGTIKCVNAGKKTLSSALILNN